MAALPPILPVSPAAPLNLVPAGPLPVTPLSGVSTGGFSFSQLMSAGIDTVNANVLQADKMARAFALDDSIPVHQVTFALEQARLSLDLAVQVRSRLLEGYQQIMGMQL